MHSFLTVSLGDAATEPTDTYAWTMKPSRQALRKRLFVVVPSVAIAAICATVLFHNVLVGIAAATLVIVTVADSFLAFTYQLSPTHARIFIGSWVWLEMPWEAVKSVSCIPEGLKLSAFANPATARLESRRGIRLAFRPADSEAVEAAVRRYRAEAQAREEKI